MVQEFKPIEVVYVTVRGKREALDIFTYAGAVEQMRRAVGFDADEIAAAIWFMQYRETFQAAGISYHNFMKIVSEKTPVFQAGDDSDPPKVVTVL